MFLRTKLGHPPQFLQQNSGVTPTLVRRFTDFGIEAHWRFTDFGADLHLTHKQVSALIPSACLLTGGYESSSTPQQTTARS